MQVSTQAACAAGPVSPASCDFLQHFDWLCLVSSSWTCRGTPTPILQELCIFNRPKNGLKELGCVSRASRQGVHQAHFKLEKRSVVFARLPPTDSFVSRKMADPRALSLSVRANARSLWGLSKQAVSSGCSLILSTQALQLSPRHWDQSAQPLAPWVFLRVCVI